MLFFDIDKEGFIDIDNYTLINEVSAGPTIRALRLLSQIRKAGGLTQFVRNSRLFQNNRLKELLKYAYRTEASIGNRSTADTLLYEAKTGRLFSRTGHLQKSAEIRNALIQILNGETLTAFETRFAIRQLLELNRAIRNAIDSSSRYSGRIGPDILRLIARHPLR